MQNCQVKGCENVSGCLLKGMAMLGEIRVKAQPVMREIKGKKIKGMRGTVTETHLKITGLSSDYALCLDQQQADDARLLPGGI